jgi:4-hydroxybenzoyl-CoA thioesterase
MPHFRFQQPILFKHCDPAGIVFYPRFFEIINDAVEAMFDDLLGWSFYQLHPDHSVPTVAMNIHFQAPCRHGDTLNVEITLVKIGRASLTLSTSAFADGTLRFKLDHTLVCVGNLGQPTPWPDHFRATVTSELESTTP